MTGVEPLHELFRAQAARVPDRPALETDDESLSYAELLRRARGCAARLVAAGVERGDVVAVVDERSAGTAVAVLGVLGAGAAYLPLDPDLPARRLETILAIAKPRALVSSGDSPIAGDLPRVSPPGGDDRGRHDVPLAPADEQELAYVIFTSGSTGTPKGVAMPHRAVADLARWEAARRPGPARVLQFAPLAFDVSCQELFSTWAAGGTLIVCPRAARRDPERLLALLVDRRIGRAYLPPAALTLLSEHCDRARRYPRDLQEVLAAGEQLRITPAMRSFFRETGAVLENQYGPTETHVVTAFALTGRAETWPELPPIGFPVANAAVEIVDEWRRAVPDGDVGEIAVGGRALADGYLNRPDLTAERFVERSSPDRMRLYLTGDLGRVDPARGIEYLGRKDRQVKVSGHRVEPAEVELAVTRHPHVVDAAVVAREVAGAGLRLVAFYVAPEPIAAAALREFLTESLPDYLIPRDFVRLDALPLTPTGKVDRDALPEVEQAPAERSSGGNPSARVAAVLSDAFRQSLALEDDYHALGLDSLTALRIVGDLADEGVGVSVTDVFEARTPAALLGRASVRARPPSESWAADVDEAPASHEQERMWFVQQTLPDSPLFNIARVLELHGPLDVPALRLALADLAARHDVLRIALRHDGERLWQVEDDELALDLEESGDAELEAARPFQLDRGPLVRTRLLTSSPEESSLLFAIHHTICDGLSLDILFDDLLACYQSRASGGVPSLAPTGEPFADYARRQRMRVANGLLAEERAAWRTMLAEVPKTLDLPVEPARPDLFDASGADFRAQVDQAAVEALRRLAGRDRATLFLAVLTTFACYLSRQLESDAFVLGVTASTREGSRFERVVGPFVNVLPVPVRPSSDATLGESLDDLARTVRSALALRSVPFDVIVADTNSQGTWPRPPLVQVLFSYEHEPLRELRRGGLTARVSNVPATAAQLDLTVFVAESEGGLTVTANYSRALFEPAWIESFVTGWIESMPRSPG